MSATLTAEATCLAVCARVTRRDGVRLAFTTYDRALVIDGTRYASRGVAPSAIVHELGAAGGSFELDLPTGADGVRVADIEAGRFDGAAVQLFVADWRAEEHVEDLAVGTVSAASYAGIGAVRFVVSDPLESRGDAGPLLCSPTCRATLGDVDCGVDMAGRRRRVLASAAGRRVRVFAAEPLEAFVGGRLRVLTGAWAGLDRQVTGLAEGGVSVDAPVPGEAAFEAELIEGCDRRLATCAGRFGNAASFRGEPYVPGTDALLRRG